MLKNVVFDFGNVLIDWDPRYLFLPHFNGDEEKCRLFLSEICNREWFTRIDRGETMDSCIADLQSRYPHYAADISLFRDRWFDMCKGEIPGMYDLILRLKSQGVGVYGLSNWPAETFFKARDTFRILKCVDKCVISSLVGLAKPDPAIYRLLLSRYGLDPADCVFVDDRKDNVNAAVGVGMKGIVFPGSAVELEPLLADFF